MEYITLSRKDRKTGFIAMFSELNKNGAGSITDIPTVNASAEIVVGGTPDPAMSKHFVVDTKGGLQRLDVARKGYEAQLWIEANLAQEFKKLGVQGILGCSTLVVAQNGDTLIGRVTQGVPVLHNAMDMARTGAMPTLLTMWYLNSAYQLGEEIHERFGGYWRSMGLSHAYINSQNMEILHKSFASYKHSGEPGNEVTQLVVTDYGACVANSKLIPDEEAPVKGILETLVSKAAVVLGYDTETKTNKGWRDALVEIGIKSWGVWSQDVERLFKKHAASGLPWSGVLMKILKINTKVRSEDYYYFNCLEAIGDNKAGKLLQRIELYISFVNKMSKSLDYMRNWVEQYEQDHASWMDADALVMLVPEAPGDVVSAIPQTATCLNMSIEAFNLMCRTGRPDDQGRDHRWLEDVIDTSQDDLMGVPRLGVDIRDILQWFKRTPLAERNLLQGTAPTTVFLLHRASLTPMLPLFYAYGADKRVQLTIELVCEALVVFKPFFDHLNAKKLAEQGKANANANANANPEMVPNLKRRKVEEAPENIKNHKKSWALLEMAHTSEFLARYSQYWHQHCGNLHAALNPTCKHAHGFTN